MHSQTRKQSIIAYPTAIAIKGKCKGIVAGYNHSYAYTDRHVYFWGEKHASQRIVYREGRQRIESREGVGRNDKMVVLDVSVDRIATAKSHTFAWNDSNVYCWGNNEYYELGLEEQKDYCVTKMDILEKAIQRGYKLRDISCGEHHTLAYFSLKNTQAREEVGSLEQSKNALVYQEEEADEQNSNEAEWQLFGWGQSNSYQLTINTTDIIPYPVLSPCTFRHLDKIYSKSDYNIALCQGKVYSWGCNLFSRLGQPIYSSQLPKVRIPREVVLPQKIVKIGIGTYHVVALSDKGSAYSWGKGNQGQLGVDKLEIQGKPSKMVCEYKIKDVSCGQSHTLVLLQDGRLMTCGSSNNGVLGHDSFDPSDKKKKVKRPQFVAKLEQIGQVISISCGNSHNLILNSKSQIFGWGSNQFYQILPACKLKESDPKERSHNLQAKAERTGIQSKDSWPDKLSDWKRRYEAFKQARNKEQELFMAELQQILHQTARQVHN